MVGGSSLYQQQSNVVFQGKLLVTFRKLYSLIIGISLGVLILSAKWDSISQFRMTRSNAASEATSGIHDAEEILAGAYRRLVWKVSQ